MKKIAVILFLATAPAAVPAAAQDASPDAAPAEDGFSLIEEGAKLLFRGLMDEMEPALQGMGEAVAELEPALKDLVAMIDDIRNYSAPEMLENGDIIIRRRSPLQPEGGPRRGPQEDPLPGPNGEIDL